VGTVQPETGNASKMADLIKKNSSLEKDLEKLKTESKSNFDEIQAWAYGKGWPWTP
jgi:hypothetical protein